jgi:adenylate cyclase
LLRRVLAGIGIGLGAALLALALGRLSFVQTVELKSYDWRMRVTADPSKARQDIVLVNIDEESIRILAPFFGRWPWPRMVHAHLLNFLARAKPKVVLYDILFTEGDKQTSTIGDEQWTGERSDAALARAAGLLGSVVFVGEATMEPLQGAAPGAQREGPALPGTRFTLDASVERRPVFRAPMPGLLAAASGVAHNFSVLDPDGVMRRYVPFIRVDGGYVPSLAVAGAVAALNLKPSEVRLDANGLWIGDRHMPLITAQIPTLDGTTRLARRAQINYRGVWSDLRHTYPTYTFAQLFQSQEQLLAEERPLVDPATLRDKVVVVGGTAAALYDQKAVPFAQKMSGPEMHAQMLDSILSNRFLTRAPWVVGVMAVLLSALAAASITAAFGPWPGVTSGIVLVAGLIFALTNAFGRGYWVPLVEPVTGVALATFGGVAYQYFVEGREKRRVKRIFSRYVSKDVYDQLIASPSDACLGGTRRVMTVLFSDIRGFTSVSERGDPEAIVGQLNQYFSTMVPIVFAHKGTVDKFVGDMIMALFSAPLDDADHADHAVETALAMMEELARLNSQWAAEGRPTLDIGIGINTGDMVAGNLGSESIMSYTVIGDNVNLGARLESLNKDYRTRVIISGATRAALKGRYDIRALGGVVVKGKSVSVEIFEVVPPKAVSAVLNAYTPLADKAKAAGEPRRVQES